MTTIINLYGSAGSGKSTAALGLSYYLKINGFKVEYVSEYAKDLVNEGSEHKLKHQLHIFSKQLKKLEVLVDKGLDYIVTDSPLFLSYFYGEKYGTSGPYLRELVTAYDKSFETVNIFLQRAFDYDNALRIQSEKESDVDSEELKQFLTDSDITTDLYIDYKDNRVIDILNHILNKDS